MRTVTFSDPAIAAFVNEHFVPAWENRKPGFHNCDSATEREIAVLKGWAFPTKNILSLILDPAGRVLHYFSGYFPPPLFRDEMDFSITLWKELIDEKGRGRNDGTARYLRIHQERLNLRLEQARSLAASGEDEEDVGLAEEIRRSLELFPGRASESEYLPLDKIREERRHHLVSALNALAQTHRDLILKVRQRGRLEPLKKSGYRYGNDFAEE